MYFKQGKSMIEYRKLSQDPIEQILQIIFFDRPSDRLDIKDKKIHPIRLGSD